MRTTTQYQPFFSRWNRKAGRRPTTREIRGAHQLARPGSKNALALAMALRKQGATQPQIILITGTPHRNVIKRVVDNGLAKVKVVHDEGGHKVFKLSLN